MKTYILLILIISIIIFGSLSVISIALTGANSFTKNQRKNYPVLKRLDGKQIFFVIIAILSTIGFFIANGLKDIATIIPQSESEIVQIANLKSETQLPKEEPSLPSKNNDSNKIEINSENQVGNQVIKSSGEKTTKIPAIKLNNRGFSQEEKTNSLPASKKEINKAVIVKVQSLSKVRRLISQAEYNEAINECDKILRINPSNSEAVSLKNWAKKQLEILNK